MHLMISMSTISNYTKFADVTFQQTVTLQFLYTFLAITESGTVVETKKGSKRVSGLTSTLTAIERVTEVRVDP